MDTSINTTKFYTLQRYNLPDVPQVDNQEIQDYLEINNNLNQTSANNISRLYSRTSGVETRITNLEKNLIAQTAKNTRDIAKMGKELDGRILDVAMKAAENAYEITELKRTMAWVVDYVNAMYPVVFPPAPPETVEGGGA